MFDICMKVSHYKGKFEVKHVSASQVIIKKLDTGESAVIKSIGSEITRVKIHKDRFVIAYTGDSLLLCDIIEGNTSEVPWRGSGNEKFDFSNPGMCMIYNAGELSIIEYGRNEIKGICKIEYMSPFLISVRMNVIAYLFDEGVIRIQDISNNTIIAKIDNDVKINYLTLNQKGTKLLFRDKQKQAYLFDISTQTKITLINYCSYVNWVLDTDVVVAQNKNLLCIWYSIEQPEKVTIYTIKGDIEDIERIDGKVNIIVSYMNKNTLYPLNEYLISLSASIESNDLERAVEILEPLDISIEVEANWNNLARLALEQNNLVIAERCYSAIGDTPKAKYLHEINKIKKTEDLYMVNAKLAILDKDFKRAEAILLEHDAVDEAMEMYQELHKWDDSIRIAEMNKHPNVEELKASYYDWLIQTGQEAKAAEIKEREEDYLTAINLYLKAKLPAKAANMVTTYNKEYEQSLLENIAKELASAGLYEKAGDLFERMEMYEEALEYYRKGHAYRKSVDLARKKFPGKEKTLEEEWGNWLVKQKQIEHSINHFIEAGAINKAIDASIISRQWSKAIQLLADQPKNVTQPFYTQIAKYYESVREYDLAEKYYVKAEEYTQAFEMYIAANKWESAYRMISQYLSEADTPKFYIEEAKQYVARKKYKEAEKLYLAANEVDAAISMYKTIKQYDNMVRLVTRYRKELLKETYVHLGKQLEKENSLKRAEYYYVEGGNWSQAMEMYKSKDLWEDAIRVARTHGTTKDVSDLAKAWGQTMDKDKGVHMLTNLGLVEASIDLLCDRKEFDEAFKLADSSAKYKRQDVHLKYALYLEGERRFKEAEENYIKANKPNEAIGMYEHLENWNEALKIAKQFSPDNVSQVYVDQAKKYIKREDIKKAEQAFIDAKRPELIVGEYVQRKMWEDALRVAKTHAPHLMQAINQRRAGKEMSVEELLASAKEYESSKEYSKAIDMYLQVNQNNYENIDQLEVIWDRAINLAFTYDKERALSILKEVGKRLEGLKRWEVAGELYENGGLLENAINCYINCKLFDKAKNVASEITSPEKRNHYLHLIANSYEPPPKLDIPELTLLAQKGQWEECLNKANTRGKDILNYYLTIYAEKLIREEKLKEAANILVRYNCPLSQEAYPIYKTLALEILAGEELNELELISLKQAMSMICGNLKFKGAGNSSTFKEFNTFSIIAHLELLRAECKSLELNECYVKICVSLLRYTKEVRVDKTFLEAGLACRSAKQTNMAFILLNRYLDFAEAIEDTEGAIALQENTDFKHTDIPSPYDVPLPDKNCLSKDKISEIKDWVLNISQQLKFEQRLNLRACDHCGVQIYEAALSCPKCKKVWEPCIASGYPLVDYNTIVCKSCQKGALKECWTEYVNAIHHCPWCKTAQ